MTSLLKLFIVFILLFCSVGVRSDNVAQLGQVVNAGYSKESWKCEIIGFYGSLIKLKTLDAEIERVFYLMGAKIGSGLESPQKSFPIQDAKGNEKLFEGAVIEGRHPNGEWYVGVVKEVYGKSARVKIGEESWAPVWVGPGDYNVELMNVNEDIEILSYKRNLVGKILKNGVVVNSRNEQIGKIYSNGKVLDSSGEAIGLINLDGSVDKLSKKIYTTNTKFRNGILYNDIKGDPFLILRFKYGALYHHDRQDIIEVFFKQEQLKGNLRLCGGVILLLKDKF